MKRVILLSFSLLLSGCIPTILVASKATKAITVATEKLIESTGESLKSAFSSLPCTLLSSLSAIGTVAAKNTIEISLSEQAINEFSQAVQSSPALYQSIDEHFKNSTSQKTYDEFKRVLKESYYLSNFRDVPIRVFEYHLMDNLAFYLFKETSLPVSFKVKQRFSSQKSIFLYIKVKKRSQKKKAKFKSILKVCENNKPSLGITFQSKNQYKSLKQSFQCIEKGYTSLLIKPFNYEELKISLAQDHFSKALVAARHKDVAEIKDLKLYLAERSFDLLIRELDNLKTAKILEANALILDALKILPLSSKIPLEVSAGTFPISIEFSGKKKKEVQKLFICP